MPTLRTPRGITPPAPGLEREEPTFVPEEDIPGPEGRYTTRTDRTGVREDHPLGSPDRE